MFATDNINRFFHRRWLIVLLVLTGFLLPLPTPASASAEPVHQSAVRQVVVQSDNRTEHKKTDNSNPKRELSAFFKIGIGLNILMVLTFTYWFIGQWKQHKK